MKKAGRQAACSSETPRHGAPGSAGVKQTATSSGRDWLAGRMGVTRTGDRHGAVRYFANILRLHHLRIANIDGISVVISDAQQHDRATAGRMIIDGARGDALRMERGCIFGGAHQDKHGGMAVAGLVVSFRYQRSAANHRSGDWRGRRICRSLTT